MLETKISTTLGAAAIGDAMGAVTENLSYSQIRQAFNGPLDKFERPGKTAFALGNNPGEITDDFSQVYMILQEVVSNNGVLSEDVVKQAMLAWSDIPKWFDRFAGPTTRAAIKKFRDPNAAMKPEGAMVVDHASKATCGAAMKIAPAGILSPGDLKSTIHNAFIITRVTHDNSLAISGACATACCCSAGLSEYSTPEEGIYAGLYGAIRGEELAKRYSREVAGASVSEKIKLAIQISESGHSKEEKVKYLGKVVGSGLLITEAVPCAFGLLSIFKDDPFQAVIEAVNIGYDTDSVACIVGTMAGPYIDKQDPRFTKLYKELNEANNFDLDALAHSIVELL